MRRLSGGLASLITAMAWAAAANAEDAIADPDERREIVVLGQRALAGGQIAGEGRVGVLGTLDPLDTPFSIRSVTTEFVENQIASNLSRAVENDPSISSTIGTRSSTWGDSLIIRGFGSGTDLNTSINGLFGLYGTTPSIDLAERIDIFKGPSAFLNGAPAAVGGSFNIQPKRALDTPLRRAGLEYLSDSIVGATVDFGGRVAGGRFGARLTAATRAGDFAHDEGERDDGNVALALDYRGGAVRVALDLIYEETLNRGYQYSVSLGSTYPADGPFPRPIDGRRRTQPGWMAAGYPNRMALARVDWEVAPGWSATAAYGRSRRTGGYDSYCVVTLRDVAGTSDCVVLGYLATQRNESADASVIGRFRTGPIAHTLVFGGNHIRNRNFATGSIPIASYTAALGNAFNYYDSADRPPRPTFPATPSEELLTDRAVDGLFVGDTLSVADDLATLTVGARRTHIRVDSFARTGARISRSDDAAITPAVAATVQPADWLTLYGNYVEALEPGGVAGGTAANAGQSFPPLRSNQIEAGVKARIGSVFATAAAFRIRKANQYLDARSNLFVQDGLQENKGLEISLAGRIGSVNVIAGASWLDAVQLETAGGAFDGRDAPAVSDFNARLGLDYRTPLPGLTLTGALVHAGDAAYDNLNTRTVPAWTRFDAGARYDFEIGDAAMVARAIVENVADARYYTAGYSAGLYVAPPRTLALSLSAAF